MAVADADLGEEALGLAARSDIRAMVGTWVFVISDAVGFSALLSTMMALGSGGSAASSPSVWLSLLFLAMTSLALLLAGRRASALLPSVALLCAIAFVMCQAVTYRSVFADGFLFVEPSEERLIVVMLFHLVHAIAGVLVLARALLHRRGTLAPVTLYWHYLALVYLVIVGLFYLP